jgi:CRISPR system Cascade subunit CasC
MLQKRRNTMLIQIHMLQNYAPSNLNRDDSGSPKSAFFGGHPRGRVSSQCLKRSIRRSQVFQEAFKADGLLADRTNRLPRLINTELEALGVAEAARQAIIKRLPEIGKREGSSSASEEDDKELKTRMLVYLTPVEATEVAQKLWALYQEHGDKGFAKLAIGDIEAAMSHAAPRSVDIAMFGRMTTSVAFENVQAAVQVAHALSTQRLVREFDYFTAVDDISGETGAGMIGDVEFNSSTYYKYFNIHWESLVDNLGGESETALKAVTALIEAAALTQPSGKQNSTAAQNLPDFVLVEVNEKNIPVSYANAFLKPAREGRENSLMQDSIAKLSKYAQQLRQAYELNGRRAYFSTEPDTSLDSAENILSLPRLQAWAAQQITEAING